MIVLFAELKVVLNHCDFHHNNEVAYAADAREEDRGPLTHVKVILCNLSIDCVDQVHFGLLQTTLVLVRAEVAKLNVDGNEG